MLSSTGLDSHSVAPDSDGEAPFPAWPDVILIDGGQGQMSAVRQILEDLGISDAVTAICIAKGADREAGRERFFMAGRPDFSLPPRDLWVAGAGDVAASRKRRRTTTRNSAPRSSSAWTWRTRRPSTRR